MKSAIARMLLRLAAAAGLIMLAVISIAPAALVGICWLAARLRRHAIIVGHYDGDAAAYDHDIARARWRAS